MSVLYKALQKAEKDNEQRHTPSSTGFDPSRLAGSGAIKLAGARDPKWRIVTFAILGVVAAAMIGSLLFIRVPQPPRRQVAAVASAPAAPPHISGSSPATPSAPASSAMQPAAGSPTAPVQVAQLPPQSAPTSTAAATPTPSAAVPQATAPEAVAPSTEKPAVVAESAAPPLASEPLEASTSAPAPSEPKESRAARAEPLKAESLSKAPATPPSPIEIPRDSPANMLSPPITISRADFALAGVGRQVQVREISKEAQDDVSAGYNALLRGEYDTALGFYDRAIEKEPTSVLAQLGRGAALQKMRRFEEAQTVYSKVLKLDPENREALTNMTALVAEKSPGEALNRLLDLDHDYPNFSPISAEIGLAYAKLGSMDQALAYLRKAIALSPDSVMYQYNLALVLDHMSLREQAISAYETVLSNLRTGRAAPELSTVNIERRVQFLRAK
jgi:tetratricopeptide (TPR) repeat protein